MTAPEIMVATSIAPSDTSTSTVLPSSLQPQIALKGLELATFTDVVFAQRPSRPLLLDLQVPAGPGPKPLVICATGGGFVMAAKENGQLLRTFLAESGFAVASIQYRTILDGADYTDGIADVREAIAFLRANAETYGLDGSRVALFGESAGAYLVTMVGLDPAAEVRSVVNKFGAVDFADIAEDFEAEIQATLDGPAHPFALYLHGPGTGKTVHDLVPDANPLNHITGDATPFQIWHGSGDRVVSPSQTLRLHNALRAAGVDSTRYVITDADHGDLAAMLGNPDGAARWYTEEVVALTVDFLRKNLQL